MDIKLLIALACLAAGSHGVPPNGSKLVPVFVSSDTLNRLGEKENDPSITPNNESGASGQQQNEEYNVRPVYEPPNQDDGHYQAQYQGNQPGPIQQPQVQPTYQIPQSQQYQMAQQQGQTQQQPYQIMQQPAIQQPYQVSQQLGQNQQPYLPAQQGNQLGQNQQPYLLAQQGNQPPIYANQQQMLPVQQLQNQPLNNQQQLQYQQQLMAQPIQTYQQQPNQILLGTQPMGNHHILTQPGQQMLLNQQTLPNQQAVLMQQPNGQYQSSSILPVNNLGQPINQVPNVQPNGNLFAVVPLNNQNVVPNQNTNTYLVPVQQTPNQMYTVNTG